MRTACVPGALALIASGAIPVPPSAAATPAPVHRCTLGGWSDDRDPAGLNVRAGPSANARVIGRLPAAFVPRRDGDTSNAPWFDITGASNGWFRIAGASDSYNPGRERPTYSGTGWVHASKVRVRVQGEHGRAGPSPTARVLVYAGYGGLSDNASVESIIDCSGRWGLMRYTLLQPPAQGPRTGEAWFAGICGEQITTCDGVHE